MIKRVECIVSGRVQMVMFRDFVERKAQKLELAGTVQNREGGTVCVIAEGNEVALKKLIAHLNKGPALAHIDNVEVVWKDSQGLFSDFSVVF